MKRSTVVITFVGLALVGHSARSDGWDEGDEFQLPQPFAVVDPPIGDVRPAAAAPAFLTSSRIAMVGDGALVSDADSGTLLLTDAKNTARSQLAIGSDAALLAYDPVAKRAYVADRRGDRIVVVGVGETLVEQASWRTPAEPYGVALAPDRKTVFVTTIADRALVAFDVATGREAWRAALDAEPRGLAIAPDGTRALVTSLTSGAVSDVPLVGTHAVTRAALPIRTTEQRAKGAFAVTFLGTNLAVTAFLNDTPVASVPDQDHYGGSSTPPIEPRLAWYGGGRQAVATTNVIEPRALAWDGSRDVLYIAGLGSDGVVAIKQASQLDVELGSQTALGKRCGADGIAIAADGSLRVWCSFTRRIASIALTKKGALGKAVHGPELVASTMDETTHAGFVLFHSGNNNISAFGQLSCGSCHLDGRADGVSWHIKGRELQTPVLAGRINSASAPFKWDGSAKDLQRSLRDTIGRLGGDGLSKKQLGQLVAFVESIPRVHAPTRDAAAVARGKKLFESPEVGCADCHDGPAFTDGARHRFTAVAFDTPGLSAVSTSAPYFHDGSAPTLEAVLRERGTVHGMAADASRLSDADVADLVAFLETL